MKNITEGKIVAQGMKFAIVASRFNDFISGKLVEGAMDALVRAGAREQDIRLFKCPGVLTTDSIEQAIERAGTKSGNKGWDAALAAIEMVDLFRKM
jgi:6,7-dimethyl-8-ribityllumazine synthase